MTLRRRILKKTQQEAQTNKDSTQPVTPTEFACIQSPGSTSAIELGKFPGW